MNINITKITNGWIVAIQAPQGQTARYCETWKDVLEYLQAQTSNK